MPDEVTLEVTQVTDDVTIETVEGDVVEIRVVATQGPTGATGATGPAGPNSVTIATSSDGTANLQVNSLQAVANLGVGSYFGVGSPNTAKGFFDTFGNTAHIQWYSDFGGVEKGYTISTTNLNAERSYEEPNANGTRALTSNTSGIPDKLTDGTIAGTLTINSTTYTYGTGAAAAHVVALGLIPTSRVVKATDETRSNNTVTADSDLVIPLEANSIYRVSLYYHYVTAISGGSITSYADYTGTLAAGVNAGDTASIFYGTASGRWVWATVTPPRLTNFTANSASPATVAWQFTVMVKTATAGNFRLMWSNGNGAGSGSGSTIVKMGSYIIAEKLL